MLDLNRPPIKEEDFIMATKATTVKTTEKKVEAKPDAKAVETKATVKKEEVKAAEKKVEVKAEPKKAETKKATKTTAKAAPKKAETKKAEPKKTTAKKTTTKRAAKKENNVYVQFAGMEFDITTVEKAVKADYTAKNGKKTMTSVSIYIKPEDMKAYYVIDGIIGDVAL